MIQANHDQLPTKTNQQQQQKVDKQYELFSKIGQ